MGDSVNQAHASEGANDSMTETAARERSERCYRKMSRFLIGFLACVSLVAEQPHINYGGVVNGASFFPPGIPGGSIAQGSLFTIFGAGLGPAGGAQASAFPLQPTLQGVSVRETGKFRRGCNSRVCALRPGECHHARQRPHRKGSNYRKLRWNGQQSGARGDRIS
jgi:hypothetical protein